MKFLSLIASFFAKFGRRKRKTVSKTKAAEPKAPDAISCFRNGIQNYSSNRYHAAIGDFTQAISIRSNFHQAFYNRGLSRLKIEDNRGADLDFTRAIEIHPVYAKAYMNRGIAKNRLGEAEAAQEDFLKSVEIDPKLYPLFTVRKIKVYKNKQTGGEDSLPEEPTSTGQESESLRTVSDEELEEKRVLKSDSENEEEGFMKPPEPESEKDEFSSFLPAEEEESEAIAEPGEADSEIEDVIAEFISGEEVTEDEAPVKSFEEPESEEEEDEFSSPEDFAADEENIVSGNEDSETDEDFFSKLLSDEIEQELLQELSDIKDEKEEDDFSKAPLQDEKKKDESLENQVRDVNETNEDSIEKTTAKEEKFLTEDGLKNLMPDQAKDEDTAGKDKAGFTADDLTKPENQVKGVHKLDLDKAEGSDERIRMPLQDREDIFEDSEITEYIEDIEELSERQLRAESEASDNETPEERLSRSSIRSTDELDPEIFALGGTIELPEQSEVKRILSESLPDSRINYARGFFYRAKLKQESGDIQGAVQDYTNAIEFYPKFSQAYLQRGIIASELNELPDAIADYSKAIEYSQRNPVAYYNRALANQKSGKNREALADFTKAIIFEPRNPQLYLLRGMLRYEMGQPRSAFSDLGRAEILGLKEAREMLQKYAVLQAKNSKK